MSLFKNGGACGYVVRQRILNLIRSHDVNHRDSFVVDLVDEVLQHFRIEKSFVPHIPLFRNALALAVQMRLLMERVTPEGNALGVGVDDIIRLSQGFKSPEDVFKLSHAEVEALFE